MISAANKEDLAIIAELEETISYLEEDISKKVI